MVDLLRKISSDRWRLPRVSLHIGKFKLDECFYDHPFNCALANRESVLLYCPVYGFTLDKDTVYHQILSSYNLTYCLYGHGILRYGEMLRA